MNSKLARTLKRREIPSYYIPPSNLHEARLFLKFENRNRGKRAVHRYRSARLKLECYEVPGAYVQLGNNIAKRAIGLAGALRYHRMERHRRLIVDMFRHVATWEARYEFTRSPAYRRLVDDRRRYSGGMSDEVFQRRLETAWIPYESALHSRLTGRYRDFETMARVNERLTQIHAASL